MMCREVRRQCLPKMGDKEGKTSFARSRKALQFEAVDAVNESVLVWSLSSNV